MFTVKVPKVGALSAATVEALGDAVWNACHDPRTGGYGASEVGSGWTVKQDGKPIGKLSYNGRFWPRAAA